MGLNQTQKNFREEMKRLEKEGYSFEDELYSTTRRRKSLKKVGIGSALLLFLVLLYPLYGMVQTVYSGLTINQHSKIVSYLEKTSELGEPFYVAINSALPNSNTVYNSSSYQGLLEGLQADLNGRIIQISNIKPPKEFEEYHSLVKERSQEIIIFIYTLKINSLINHYDDKEINTSLNRIRDAGIRERLALAKAFDEVGIKYKMDTEYNIEYEYKTY